MTFSDIYVEIRRCWWHPFFSLQQLLWFVGKLKTPFCRVSFFPAVESKPDEFCCSFLEISLIPPKFWVETNFCQDSDNPLPQYATSPPTHQAGNLSHVSISLLDFWGDVLIGGWSMTEVSLIRVSSASLTSTLVFAKPRPKITDQRIWAVESLVFSVGANTITTCLV